MPTSTPTMSRVRGKPGSGEVSTLTELARSEVHVLLFDWIMFQIRSGPCLSHILEKQPWTRAHCNNVPTSILSDNSFRHYCRLLFSVRVERNVVSSPTCVLPRVEFFHALGICVFWWCHEGPNFLWRICGPLQREHDP